MYDLFDLILLTDMITSNPTILTFEDTISFSDSVLSSPFSIAFRDRITISDSLVGNVVISRTVADSVTWTESIHPRSAVVGFEDHLPLVDWFEKIPHNLYDTLVFEDTIVADKSGFFDHISFTETIEAELVRIYVLSDTLTFTEGIPHYFLDPWRM